MTTTVSQHSCVRYVFSKIIIARAPLAAGRTLAMASISPATPYPDKYHAATRAGRVVERTASDETKLLLYALRSQATSGPCVIQSKWGMENEARAKYETWCNLGKMETFEAMRLYVKLIDEERPEWWKSVPSEADLAREDAEVEARSARSPLKPRGNTSSHHRAWLAPPSRLGSILSEYPAGLAALAPGRWATPGHRHGGGTAVSVAVSESPPARYQHGACVAGTKMFIVGGSRGSRFLADAHVLDLKTLEWSALHTPSGADPLPACAGHRLLSHEGEIYLVGGAFGGGGWLEPKRSLSDLRDRESVVVLRADVDANARTIEWKLAPCTGPDAPSARRGMSVTRVGDEFVLFGGEDRGRDRSYKNDAWALHVKTLRWRCVHAGSSRPRDGSGKKNKGGNNAYSADVTTTQSEEVVPRARCEHVACAWGDDQLIVHGGAGASSAGCFDDVFVLDLATSKWAAWRPAGPTPAPRAGHAAVVIRDRYWCVIGGGNDATSVGELRSAALDLRESRWVDLGADADAADESDAATSDDADESDSSSSRCAFPTPAVCGEGMSACVVESASGDAALIAFGGYDGATRRDVQAFRFPDAFPAAPPPSPAKKKEKKEKKAAGTAGTSSAPLERATSLDAGGAKTQSDSSTSASTSASTSSATDALASDNLRLRGENARLRDDARRVLAQHTALANALEQTERDRARAVADRDATAKSLAASRTAAAAATAALDEARGEIAAAAGERDALRARVEALERRVRDLGGEEEEEDKTPKKGWFASLLLGDD